MIFHDEMNGGIGTFLIETLKDVRDFFCERVE